jgi:membrane-associated protease RseP (regulator of RpoE activity)
VFFLIFALAIGFAIMLHEAGHFLTARLFGMKCSEFFVGFGPRVWSFRRGETEYGVKAIPAGGYVRILGMNSHDRVDEQDRPRAFYNQPAWQRLVVLVAGSFTHFVIAALLLFVTLAFFAVPRLEGGEPVVSNVTGEVLPGDPAAVAGIEPGDEIVAIDGQATDDFDDIVDIVATSPGEVADVTILRDGERETRQVTIASQNPDGEDIGYLGVSPEGYAFDEGSVAQAATGVFVGEYSLPTLTYRSLAGIAQIFTPESLSNWIAQADTDNARTADGPISLVGAAQVGNQLVRLGAVSSVLLLLAQLNIVLGALNMLPLPPLDGGHVAIVLVERVVNAVRARRGRSTDWELDPAVVTPVALVVILFLGLFGLTALYIDIVNPASQLLQ